MKKKRAANATIQLKLRFPARLRKRLEVAAKAERRSLNREIVHRIEESLYSDEVRAALVAALMRP